MMTEHSVAPPQVVRDPAGYGSRLLAATIDVLLLYLGLYVIAFGYVWLAQPTEPVMPTPIAVSQQVIPALYVLATGVLGRTLGMLATGLHISGADGAAPSQMRLFGRAVVLLGFVAIVFLLAPWWLEPLLLLGYSLLMLANPKHQLPHDQLFGTTVVGRATPVASQETIDRVRAQYGDLPSPEAKMLLGDLEKLRRRTQGALHLASVPMFVLGLIALGTAAVSWDDAFPLFGASTIYLTLAAPAGLAATAWWFHRQQRSRGAGTGARSAVIIASFVTLVSLVAFFFPALGVIAGAGFLAIAIIQRSVALGGAAIVFALITTLELPFGVLVQSAERRRGPLRLSQRARHLHGLHRSGTGALRSSGGHLPAGAGRCLTGAGSRPPNISPGR